MINTLVIGDPHAQINHLPEMVRLFDFIFNIAKEDRVSKVVILGDLMHNHAILRSEVVSFWNDVFSKLSTLNKPIIVLKGNHEELGNLHIRDVHALKVFKDKFENVTIVDESLILDGAVFVGHDTNHEKFIQVCVDAYTLGANEVIAHQNFTEDLFGDKIDPDKIPQQSIISGHIHNNELSSGKVFYAGTPRWGDSKDANKSKGVWIINGNEREFISTESVCQVIKKYFIKEGEEIPTLDPRNKNYLELEGSNAWILLTKKKLKEIAGLQIKAIPTDTRIVQNKANIKTINDFLHSSFKLIPGVKLEEVQSYIGAI